MDRVVRLAALLAAAACGPDQPDAPPGGTGDDGSTGGDAPTSGAVDPGPPVCLTPQPGDLPVAGDALECVAPEHPSGEVTLIRGEWPPLDVGDCAPDGLEVDVPCTATAIQEVGGGAAIALDCAAEDDPIPPLTLSLGAPALFFPVCAGDPLRLRYRRYEHGCPNGGYEEAMAVYRADSDTLLVASFYGHPEPWTPPLTVAHLPDAGCAPTEYPCTQVTRAAVRISDPSATPAVVYDGTRRLLELGARHVAQLESEIETVTDDECESFSLFRLTLVRVDP